MFAFLFPRLKDSRYATTQSISVPRLFSTKNSRQPSTCGRCLPPTRGVDCSTFSQREKTPMYQSDRISRTLLCKHREQIFTVCLHDPIVPRCDSRLLLRRDLFSGVDVPLELPEDDDDDGVLYSRRRTRDLRLEVLLDLVLDLDPSRCLSCR